MQKRYNRIPLLVVIIIVCIASACQPTPEKEIVQGKNDDILEQAINEDDSALVPCDNTGERADMIVTGTWQDDSIESKPYLSVSADAQVLIPDIDQYMAYEIDPSAKLTNDMVRKLIGALVGDAVLHDGDEISKDEIEARLVHVRKEINDLNNNVGKDSFSSEEGEDYDDYKNYMIKRLGAEIKVLSGLMETATDGYETTIDINTINFANIEQFEAKAFVGRSNVATILLVESCNFMFNNPGNFSIGENYMDESEKEIDLSTNDAAAIGNSLLSDAGLLTYDIKSIGLGQQYIGNEGAPQTNSPQGYVMQYDRIVNGMPVSSTTRFNVEQSMINDYVQYFQDELLQLAIDDAGIAQLYWESYYALDEASASVVEIMPMDEEMKDIIIQQIYNCYSPFDEQDKTKVKYIIDKVELVMGRVPMKDNPKRQWLIPVWNVYATSQSDTGEGYVPSDRGSLLVLSVNALDGSIN